MRVVLVVDIEVADSGNVSAVVGAIREGVERAAETDPVAGVGMTAHVGDAADRIMDAVTREMGEA